LDAICGHKQAGRVYPAGGPGHDFRDAEVDALFGRPKTYSRNDFAPIALLNADTTVLVTSRDAPGTVWPTWWPMPKAAKEIKFSTAGIYSGLHLPMAMFTQARHRTAAHPFPGRRAGLTALLAAMPMSWPLRRA